MNTIAKCPLCGGDIIETDTAYSCSACKCTVLKTIAGTEIRKEQAVKLLLHETVGPMKFTSKHGTDFTASLLLNESGRVEFEF